MARKAISKRVRFEVFKRDEFQCQYCGAAPPKVLLHIDHIVPVASGGDNDMDNLLTACDACNMGKGAVSLDAVPQSLSSKAADIVEREEQLRAYNAIMAERRQRIEDEKWDIAFILFPTAESVRRDWLLSIKRFLEKLGYPEVESAAETALAKKGGYADTTLFRYFCGVCWGKIKQGQQ